MADTILYKSCSRCKQSLPLTAFCKDKSKKSGLRYNCKACHRANYRRYYPAKPTRNASFLELTGKYAIEHLPEKDLAYIAGLFDGEGCIFIRTQYYGPGASPAKAYGKSTSGKSHAVMCAVGMTNESIIMWLKEATGMGSIYHKAHGSTRNSKPAWYWKLNPCESTAFLLVIKDYLRIKGPQAELGLELARIKTMSRRFYKHMPERQLEIVNEMAALNRRGIASDEKEAYGG